MYEIGKKVERISSDYTNGRIGTIVDIDIEKQRARVYWEAQALRTWVNFKFLKLI